MHASIESDRLQRPSMALRFESLNKISRFMTFLERILVMPVHMLFLTAVCLGKVRYVQYVQYAILECCILVICLIFLLIAGFGHVLPSSTNIC